MAAILFVMKYPLHRKENLRAKFDGQMAAMRALGQEVYTIGWDREGMWLVGNGVRELLHRSPWTGLPGYDHTLIFGDLMMAVRQTLKKRRIDVVYLRYMPTFSSAVKTVKLLKKQGGRLVIEFPTYPREQENKRSLLRRPVFAYTDFVLRRIHSMVDLYTVIGKDCGGVLDGRPAINIVNGIFVDNLPQHIPCPQEKAIHMLALASMAGWHGYDRMIRALAAYSGEEMICLHMVGGDGDGSLGEWQALAAELGLGEKVVFHGALYGNDLEAVVAQSDVGIGSLGMFRFGFASGMTLKIREFMARGLPFVYAVDDPSLPEDARFCLRVENSEAPIDMAQIVAFAKAAKADEVLPAQMRAYAREHMSWESAMGSVLERLNL